MGLEKVKEHVLEEAMQKAKARIESANAEAHDILKSFSQQIKEKEAAFKSNMLSEIASIKKREAASAKLESKKLPLTLRKDFIEGVLSSAKERLSKLSDSERSNHIKKLLQKANSELKVEVVYCNKKDAKFASNYKVKEADIIGGIIAESADGTLRVDYSYEAMLDQIKQSLLPELDKLLFTKK